LIALIARVRVTAAHAYQPIEEPVIPAIRGAMPVKNRNVIAMAEPGTEPNNSNLGQTVVNTAAGVGGAIAATGIIGGASKLLTAGSQTKTAILDARTTPSNITFQNAKQTTKWGRFLAFVERKAPKLFARIGVKLATAGALAAVPLVGWVGAAIQLGLTLWTAYELYELWKEFTNEEESETLPNNPPLLDKSKYDNPPKPIELTPPDSANAPANTPAPAAGGGVLNEQRKSKPYPAGTGMDSGNEYRPSMAFPTAANAAATSSLASKMKKGDTFAHPHQPGTDILAQKIMSGVPEFAQFTGFNDKFHQQNHPRSKHAKGLAIDFVTKGGAKTQDAAVRKIEKMMTDAGLKSGDYLVQSEILGKTPHATGDHVHVEFKDELVAEQFRTHAMNAGMVPSAYAKNPNAPPTQLAAGSAAPAAASATPAVAPSTPKSVNLSAASQTNRELTRQPISSSGSPVINNVVNNNGGGGGGGGTTIIAGASLYDKDLVDLFMDSLGTA
jgi:hypothetical protein